MNSEETYNIRAAIYKIGINFCVDIPGQISKNLGGEKYLPVKGIAGGIQFTSTLVPRGNDEHRLFIHSKILKALSLREGNEIEIWLEPDPEKREPLLPEDFKTAIENNPKAAKRFNETTPTMRLRIVEWVNDSKKISTRERRILTAIERLETGGRLG